jgi:8-oxo-dGTP diphosphatase
MESQYLHEVAITAIIYNSENKYLIIKRSSAKKRFPNMWTVPGGKLETKDYLDLPKDTTDYWYNVLERTLRREVEEEVRLQIDKIEYLTSLATVHKDGSPSLVISCTAEYTSGDITLQPEEADDSAWVSVEEAKGYDLIDGILDELVLARPKTRRPKSRMVPPNLTL